MVLEYFSFYMLEIRRIEYSIVGRTLMAQYGTSNITETCQLKIILIQCLMQYLISIYLFMESYRYTNLHKRFQSNYTICIRHRMTRYDASVEWKLGK